MDVRLEPVLAETNDNRARFERFCRSLDEAELVTLVPGDPWTVRDYIAHLATIDTWVAEWFEALAEGRRWAPAGRDGAAFNIDTWNEGEVRARTAHSVEELLDEAAGHRARLLAAFPHFTAETLDQEFTFRDQRISFLRYLQLWAGHDPAHSQDMLRALPGRQRDPELNSWLSRYQFPRPSRE